MFRPMRRNEREIQDQQVCWDVLAQTEFGVLSVAGDDGYPYGIPLNHVVIDGAIYFHGALQGHKIDAIRRDNKACYTVTHGPLEGKDHIPPDTLGTYQSVVIFGRVTELPPEQRLAPLIALCRRYVPERVENKPYFDKYMPSLNILKLEVEHISGKQLLVK